MAANESRIIGWEEVSRRLLTLPGNVQKNVVRRAMAAAARAVRDEARLNVPVRTGSLRQKLTSGTRKSKTTGEVRAYVGVAKGKFYLRADGRLDKKAKAGSSYRIKVSGKGKARVVVVHPRRYAHLVEFGSANNPPSAFMRRAARSKTPEVIAIIEKRVRANLEKELKRR